MSYAPQQETHVAHTDGAPSGYESSRCRDNGLAASGAVMMLAGGVGCVLPTTLHISTHSGALIFTTTLTIPNKF